MYVRKTLFPNNSKNKIYVLETSRITAVVSNRCATIHFICVSFGVIIRHSNFQKAILNKVNDILKISTHIFIVCIQNKTILIVIINRENTQK